MTSCFNGWRGALLPLLLCGGAAADSPEIGTACEQAIADETAALVEEGFHAPRGVGLDIAAIVELDPDGIAPSVIYGEDSRVEIEAAADPTLRAMAASVALVTNRSQLTARAEGGWTLRRNSWTFTIGPICEDEPFRGQPTGAGGECSSFLIAPDLLVTAGHCITTTSCANRAFVFDYKLNPDGTAPPWEFTEDQVYFCDGIVARQYSSGRDWAVVRLDRPVPDRMALRVRTEGEVPPETPLAMIGFPAALPMKMADGAMVTSAEQSGAPYFQANLDAYGGNSGSPVISLEDYTVEGILVRGVTDYRLRPGESCAESNRVPLDGAGGAFPFEEVSRTTDFVPSIPGGLETKPTPWRLLGDFNNDGWVDLADFAILLDHWGGLFEGLVMEFHDFLALLEHWNPPPQLTKQEPVSMGPDGVLTILMPDGPAWPGNAPAGIPREEAESLFAMELAVHASDSARLHLADVSLGPEGLLLLSRGGTSGILVYTQADVEAGGFLTPPDFLPGTEPFLLEVLSPSPTGEERFRVAAVEHRYDDPSSDAAIIAQVDAGFAAKRLAAGADMPDGSHGPKVIYGEDSRIEIEEETDPQLRAMAHSVALVTNRSNLTLQPSGLWRLDRIPWTFAGGTLCLDEPFRGQPSGTGGDCSSFLIAPDLLVTAGHCISSLSCSQRAFIFDYRLNPDGGAPQSWFFDSNQIYYCQGIEARQLGAGRDWAIVRLDRPVPGREPLPIREEGAVEFNTPLAMIGFPAALPMKVAKDATVRSLTGNSDPFFQANLDAYGGNSGSPVINLGTHEVEGILVRGLTDFVTDQDRNCRESNRVPLSGGSGALPFEEVSRTTDFAADIPDDPDPTPTVTPTPSPTPPVHVPRTQIIDTILGYIGPPGDPTFEAGDRNGDGVWDAVDVMLPAQ